MCCLIRHSRDNGIQVTDTSVIPYGIQVEGGDSPCGNDGHDTMLSDSELWTGKINEQKDLCLGS